MSYIPFENLPDPLKKLIREKIEHDNYKTIKEKENDMIKEMDRLGLDPDKLFKQSRDQHRLIKELGKNNGRIFDDRYFIRLEESFITNSAVAATMMEMGIIDQVAYRTTMYIHMRTGMLQMKYVIQHFIEKFPEDYEKDLLKKCDEIAEKLSEMYKIPPPNFKK